MANAMLEEEYRTSQNDLYGYHEEENNRRDQHLKSSMLSSTPHERMNILLRAHHQTEENHMISTQRQHQHQQQSSPKKSMTTRKSVDFAILPPSAKRTRYDNNPEYYTHDAPDKWTAMQVVDAISTCIRPNERLEAIQKAKEAFDHNDQTQHNDEMSTGVDAAMTKHLTFLVYNYRLMQEKQKQNPNVSSNLNSEMMEHRKEISLTLDTMESLYRASSSIVGASFQRMGKELVNLLVTIIDDEINQRVQVILATQQQQQELMICDASPRLSSIKLESSDDDDYALETREIDKRENTNGNRNYPSRSRDDLDDYQAGEQKRMEANVRARRPLSAPPSLPRMVMSQSGGSRGQQQQLTVPQQHQNYSNPDDSFLENKDLPPPGSTPDGDLLLRKSAKLLGHLARVGNATETMAHFPGLLGSLINLISLRPFESAPWEARLSALWVIANLACNTENMQMMVCTPGLISALVDVASRPLKDRESLEVTMEVLRSRSIASRAILNLSWAPQNKILLSEHAALIDMLCDLCVARNPPLMCQKSRTVQEIMVTTRRHAAGAIRNLAAAPRRIKIGLCGYKNGHLLSVMTDAALNDPDIAVQERVYGAIHNLANQDTAEKIVSHPALVLALKDVLLTPDEADRNVTYNEPEDGAMKRNSPKQHASATIMVLERSITPDMDAYENLRDLLDAINPSANSGNESEAVSEHEGRRSCCDDDANNDEEDNISGQREIAAV